MSVSEETTYRQKFNACLSTTQNQLSAYGNPGYLWKDTHAEDTMDDLDTY